MNHTYRFLTILLFAAPLLNAEPWKHIIEADGVPTMMVQFMKCYGDEIWVGTLDGLAVFRDGKPKKVIERQAAWDVLPNGKGRYWVGTQRGVILLDGEKTIPGLEGYSVGSLEAFGDKAIWACAEKQNIITLMEHQGGSWKPVPRFKRRSAAGLFRTRAG
ncbi:MAG: hypothetical protein O2821_13805, partial [Chloroflexi bacterium]|nr:hypothetical protein [Chloroflexota bacterium]